MANLKSFKRASSFKDGAWKKPDADRDLEILTRGLTEAYYDAQESRQRKAAKGFGGDVSQLPIALKRKINVECLIDKCLMEVRLKDDDGKDVSFDEFCDAIRDPDCVDLYNAAFTAAAMVSSDRASDAEEATGN